MKKILLLTIILLSLFSCDSKPTKEYTLIYKVYYPGNTKEYTVINTENYRWSSSSGTNYIVSGSNNYIYHNTAPFEIISYTSKDIKP